MALQVGLFAAAIPLLVTTVWVAFDPAQYPKLVACLSSLVFYPICLAIALHRHRLFGVGSLLSPKTTISLGLLFYVLIEATLGPRVVEVLGETLPLPVWMNVAMTLALPGVGVALLERGSHRWVSRWVHPERQGVSAKTPRSRGGSRADAGFGREVYARANGLADRVELELPVLSFSLR